MELNQMSLLDGCGYHYLASYNQITCLKQITLCTKQVNLKVTAPRCNFEQLVTQTTYFRSLNVKLSGFLLMKYEFIK